MKRISSVVALTALALAYASAALAAGGVVGTGTPGSCTETAFDAVFAKAQTSGGGVISFNCGAMPHAIVFTVYKSVATNTEIQGGDLITLSGSNTTAVFQVSTLGTLKLGNLVITRAYSAAGAIENFGRLTVVDARLEGNTSIVNGGAISNHAEATLTNVVVTGNEALEEGGGLHSDGGTLTIRNSQITNNVARRGGGVANASGVLAIESSSVARNQGNGGGGLHLSGGATTALRTVIAANTAAEGAGIWLRAGSLALDEVILANNGGELAAGNVAIEGGALNQDGGSAVLTNVSVVNNRAAVGAGILAAAGTTKLTNVTISGNAGFPTAGIGEGSGITAGGGDMALTNVTLIGNSTFDATTSVLDKRGPGKLTLISTVLANPGNRNCSAAMAGATFSYSSDGTCGFGAARDNAVLAFDPLATNGGFTLTHMPRAGNPVIDNGAGAGCPSVDQRGVTRPSGIACDAGAVEYVAGAPALATVFEYFDAGFGHYFVTLLADEIAKLDAGSFVGWTRTGQQFNVYRSAGAGRVPVCRFFTLAFPPEKFAFLCAARLWVRGHAAEPGLAVRGRRLPYATAGFRRTMSGRAPAGISPLQQRPRRSTQPSLHRRPRRSHADD